MILFVLLAAFSVSSAEFCLGKGVLDTFATPHKCLYFVLAPLSYDEANMACASLGGTLTSIASAFEQSLIVGQSRDKLELDDYWIGLTNLLDTSQWQWNDGSSFTYTNWMIDPLTNDPANNNCVSGRLSNGKWYNLNCDSNIRNFICKSEPFDFASENSETFHCAPPTADGRLFGKCYLPLNVAMAYKKAEMVCASFDGDLVSINNATEMSLVAGSGRSALADKKEYWIGLNNFFDEFNWTWTGDTDSDYRNWAGSPPSNVSTAEGCVSASVRTGKWLNKRCTNWFTFICELPPTEVPPASVSSPSSSTCPSSASCPCDSNWMYFPPTNSCYQGILHNSTGYWHYALEKRCVALGGHLASLHSPKEENFVIGIGSGVINTDWTYITIGYRSFSDVYSFEWTDGSANDYVHWHNPPTAGNLCTYVQRGLVGFVSDSCIGDTGEWAGVCKKPAH